MFSSLSLVSSSLFLLIDPVRGNALLIFFVHLAGTDLEFQDLFVRSDDRGVQTAVGVRLWQSNVIFYAARKWRPGFVDHAERGVTFRDRFHNDAHGNQVIDFIKIHIGAE